MPEAGPVEVTAHTEVGRRGWALRSLDVSGLPDPASWTAGVALTTPRASSRTSSRPEVLAPEVDAADGVLRLRVPGHLAWPTSFEVHEPPTSRRMLDERDVTDVRTAWADRFEAQVHGSVRLRLYRPATTQPRPLILFLHGGEEAGEDNWAQLVGTFGAAHLARTYPGFFVMAPQASASGSALPPPRQPFASSGLDPDSGWHRDHLSAICGLIRSMIAAGSVDARRVYATGVSMGGAGVLRTLSVDPELFAAAAPVCPTMTPETSTILRSLVASRIWVSTAYVDHTIYRHKYVAEGVLHLRDRGNPHARFSLFSPEQLAKHGIAQDQDRPLDELFAENHGSWVATYEDEDGILTWLTSQVRDLEPR
jgi:predicted peptidase